MKSSTTIILTILFFLAFSSCETTYSITSDFEDDVNFSAFETFKILEHETRIPYVVNPINQQRIERSIVQEMESLGYENTENDYANLEVSWFVIIKTVKDIEYYNDHYRRYSFPQYTRVIEYQEGTLVIDIIDSFDKKVIWHGKTTGRVSENIEKPEEKIAKVVKSMFEKFKKDAGMSL